LLTLADLQKPSGFWKLDEELAKTIQLTVDKIKSTIPPHCTWVEQM
uniref:DHC_N2 domain-containing protein n=1 Tax=Echinostoma caproni TaxID=27848 RepID=A0A183A3F1_9TREM